MSLIFSDPETTARRGQEIYNRKYRSRYDSAEKKHLSRLNTTVVTLSRLMRSAHPNEPEKTSLLADLHQQIIAARSYAKTLSKTDGKAMIAQIMSMLQNTGLEAVTPARQSPAAVAPPPAPTQYNRRASDILTPAPTPNPEAPRWKLIKLAQKTDGPTKSALGIAEVSGSYVVFQGEMGQEYNVSQPGSLDAAEERFAKSAKLGFREISSAAYPVIRGGRLPDLQSFGKRREVPIPKRAMQW